MELARVFSTLSIRSKVVHLRAVSKLQINGFSSSSECFSGVTKGGHEKKSSKLPEPPKRPLSSFLAYVKDEKQSLQKNHPQLKDVSYKELLKSFGLLWRGMPEEKKFRYNEQYKADFNNYKKQMELYIQNIGEDAYSALQDSEKEKRKNKKVLKEKLMKKKELKELGKPVKPMSPYVMMYVESKLSMKDFAKKWKGIPEHEKEHYKKRYEQEFNTYKLTMQEWRNRMEREGNLDIIKSGTKRSAKISSTKSKATSSEHESDY